MTRPDPAGVVLGLGMLTACAIAATDAWLRRTHRTLTTHARRLTGDRHA